MLACEIGTRRMHPVQAAPRQSRSRRRSGAVPRDAPRAGSAEAKILWYVHLRRVFRCTPCRQRRGKDSSAGAPAGYNPMHPVQAAPRQSFGLNTQFNSPQRCTPCRQRRGKDRPRRYRRPDRRCTPCRQRRGKGPSIASRSISSWMHPVQAAPRQRLSIENGGLSSTDAPRAGSAEAKTIRRRKVFCTHEDAPRAGSAEAKRSRRSGYSLISMMHPVQAAPRQSCPGDQQLFVSAMHPVQAAPRQRQSRSRRP